MKKDITPKQIINSLLPVFNLKNVPYLHQTSRISDILSLPDEGKLNLWNEHVKATYDTLLESWENYKNNGKINKNTNFLELKLYESKEYKKINDEENKIEYRRYSTRSIWGNWAMSAFILYTDSHDLNEDDKVGKTEENKDFRNQIWDNFNTFKNSLKYGAELLKKTKTFGYLLNINQVNEYMYDGEPVIDESDPYIYHNWKWSYQKYINHVIKKGVNQYVVKTDLSNAFPNIIDDFLNDIITEKSAVGFLAKLHSIIRVELQNGIPYGNVVESYIIANYAFIKFKDALYKKIKEKDIDLDGIYSYVDDNYIILKSKKDAEIVYEMLVDKDLSIVKKGEKEIFLINKEKTENMGLLTPELILQDSDASTITNTTLSDEGNLFSLKLNIKIKLKDEFKKMNPRLYAKIQISELARKWRNNELKGKDYTTVFQNKYSNKFFKQILSETESKEYRNVIMKFLWEVREEIIDANSKSNNGKAPLTEKVIDEIIKNKLSNDLSRIYFPDSRKMRMLTTIIEMLSTNKEFVNINSFSLPNLTIEEQENIKVAGSKFHKLIAIKTWLEDKKYSNSKSISFEAVDYVKSKLPETWMDTEILDQWIKLNNNNNITENETDIDYYFKKLYENIIVFMDVREDSLLRLRIDLAKRMSRNRLEFVKSIGKILIHIVKNEIEKDETTKMPRIMKSIDAQVTDEDINMAYNFSKLTRYNKDKKKKSAWAGFGKADYLIMLRYYIGLSWENGSRELEHFSNHSNMHNDTLLMYLDGFRILLRDHDIDWYIVAISIYIHDIGLIDDEHFISKISSSGIWDLDDYDIKGSYMRVKDKFSLAARNEHGATSKIVSKLIYDSIVISTTDLNYKTFDKATKSAAIHNGSLETYSEKLVNIDIELKILSILDLFDVKWTRIQRPYKGIGTYTASANTKRFWIKDLMTENTTLIINEKDMEPLETDLVGDKKALFHIEYHKEYLEDIIANVEDGICTISKRFRPEYELKIENKNIHAVIKNRKYEFNSKEMKKMILLFLYETEIKYISRQMRKNYPNKTFDIYHDMKLVIDIAVTPISSNRVFNYRTLTNDSKEKNNEILWNKEVFQNPEIIKQIIEVWYKYIDEKGNEAIINNILKVD